MIEIRQAHICKTSEVQEARLVYIYADDDEVMTLINPFVHMVNTLFIPSRMRL